VKQSRIHRRSLLKAAGLGSLLIHASWLNALTLESDDADVTFLKKEHKLFNVYRRLFNKRFDMQPQIMAICKTEHGVQKAVNYANEHDLDINIKSGGHSFEGFSLNDNGVVFDLSHMNALVLDDHHKLVAGPAVRLAQLYSHCLPKGRLLPSGSCASVGLSGITLGGGYGLFARQFGLTCDYLTGVRMVDINGNILDSDDWPELLWACRGAGNGNFGVITQLRFNTVEAPKTLYQHRFRSFKLSSKKAAGLAKLWFEQCDSLPNHAFSAFVLNGKTLTVMLTATEQDESMVEVLKNFDRIMDKNDNLNPDPLEVGVKYYYGRSDALYFKNISAGFYKNFSDIEECVETLFEITANTKGAVFQINTLGGNINNEKWLGEGAYAHRKANYLGEAQCYWEKSEDMQQGMDGMKSIQNALYENNVKEHYVNYPDVNIIGYESAYYGDGYARLQALKQQLDPDNRFNYSQSINAS
jgi:hypothetical protein